MTSEKSKKNANFLHIVKVLKNLKDKKKISDSEYEKAKSYYFNLLGADMII